MFQTLEELKEKFPVGSIYKSYDIVTNGYFYTNDELKMYQKEYDKVEIIYDYCVKLTKTINIHVDGYIFNGKKWYPAKQTWDGWELINENEINMENFE